MVEACYKCRKVVIPVGLSVIGVRQTYYLSIFCTFVILNGVSFIRHSLEHVIFFLLEKNKTKTAYFL